MLRIYLKLVCIALSWTPRRLPPSLRRRQSKPALGRASAGSHGSGGPPAEYSTVLFLHSNKCHWPLDVRPFPFPSPFRRTPSFLLPCLPCFLSLALGQHCIVSHGGCLLQSFLGIFYQSFTLLTTVFFHTFLCVQCKVSCSLPLSFQLP